MLNLKHSQETSGHTMRRLCFTITRSLVIIVNLISTALALLLIYTSFNLFSKKNSPDLLNDGPPKLDHIYVILTAAAIGLIIALLSLLGLFGAIKKSKSALGTYAAIVFFLISLLFILVVVTYTMPNNPPQNYKDLDKSFVNYTIAIYNYVDPTDDFTKLIDNVQKRFACCGVNSPNDWLEYYSHKIPKSCCLEPVESSLPKFKYCAESDFRFGCYRALMDSLYSSLPALRAILYVIMVFGLICTTAAFFMIRTLRRSLDVV